MRALLLLAVVWLVGCATFRGTAGPRSESGWYEIKTPHFVLYTDLDGRAAGDAAVELERTRDALISAAWPAFHFPEMAPTRVFVLANGVEFERIFGRYVGGMFMSSKRPAFFLYGTPDRWRQRWFMQQRASFSVLRHEMAHQLAAVVYSGTPRWFDEGLAQFLETVEVSEDGTSVMVGRTNVRALSSYYAARDVTIRRTLEWTEAASEISSRELTGLYGTSWVFFHWLYNQRPQQFSRYQLALAEHVDPKLAWDSTFRSLDLDALEPILYEYLKHGIAAVDTFPLITTEPRLEVRAMTAADAHAARAQIALSVATAHEDGTNPLQEEGIHEIASSLELDPTNVEALLLADHIPPGDRLRLVRAAAVAHPSDGAIQGLLGDLLADRAEREAAYRHALTYSPDDPNLLNALAWLLLSGRRASEALPLALHALKRAPHDLNVLDTYAEALSQMGRCESAIAYERRAVERAREANTATRQRLTARLATMRASCDVPQRPQEQAAIVLQPERDVAEPPAREQVRREKRAAHSGLYGALGVGVGYGLGTFATRGSGWQDVEGSFEGGGVNFDVALGYGIRPGFALAIEGGIVGHPDVRQSAGLPEEKTYGLVLARVGGMLDVYLTPSFHLQGGVDWVQGSWTRLAWLPDETPTGLLVHVAAGPVWRFYGYDLGPSLRVYQAKFTSDHSDGSALGVLGVVNAVWF
jgi:tetratricopeptide (TPR) repeat protein